MDRHESILSKGWQFAFGTRDKCPTEGFVSVTIPHDWVIGRKIDKPENYTYREMSQGFFDRYHIGWYRRSFQVNKLNKNEVITICFGGVYENCTVWINGQKAGGQRYGYTSFELDVTSLVHEGENEIIVRVDNTAEPADRWYSGCGIYRPVKIIRMSKQHLKPRDIIITTSIHQDTALVKIQTGTDSPVRALLVLPNGQSHTGEGNGKILLTVQDAPLWSSDSPKLCKLTLSLLHENKVEDTISYRIGLREISFGKDGMLVNGKPEKLRGMCIHQDFACVGIAVIPELWRERLLLLKDLGCNAIRASHHPHSDEFMDLCDEMGFYVYEECFDKWHSGAYGRYFESDWQHDLDAMITRDRNRPSVVIWGVGNEVENQALPSMLKTLKMLVSRVKELDPSRPVTYAMNPHFKRPVKVDLTQIKDIQKFVDEVDDREIEDVDERISYISKIADLVDIISCNYQEQWYNAIHIACPDKLILGTEIYQYFIGHRDNMQNYVEHLPSLVPMEKDYVIGGFVWTGFDYLGESMGWPSKGWPGSLYRTNNVPRFSRHIHEAIWAKKPIMRIGLLDYTLPDEFSKEHWSIPPYEELWDYPQVGRVVLPIMAATNCERVIIDYGPKVLILDDNNRDTNGMLRGYIPYVPGRLIAKGYIGDKEVCTQVIETPDKVAKLAFEPYNHNANQSKAFLLTVMAQDAKGRPVLRSTQTVTFKADGGVIIGTDNGDLTCHIPYSSHSMPMYRGRVSVLVLANGQAPLTVIASADGLQAGIFQTQKSSTESKVT